MYSIILCPIVALKSGLEPRTNVILPLRRNVTKVSTPFDKTYQIPSSTSTSENQNLFSITLLPPPQTYITHR